ncbi:D-glycero-beta-D-manno-heptose 1,7-bisphosphate 7-phosphatase [Selenomonas sp. TAMA-11512]|uniref:D-glycero-alpha-D-manno-heptose-1,7-bisphosphate 7-phosphatase n=1 Tax=Selenomonas sp. TAMA-11512 TaxID=3095337 RepID=UPI003084BDD0|nr:D-glycero-beta-D-manno-heptose 1,7-bisphosphate 7-phosphatase [Selenomonas sp. TAMA-11512]
MASKSAVFFDRDGTLNVDVHFLHEIEKFRWVEGAVDAVRAVNARGALAIVITNQSGIARGYYTEEEMYRLHEWMNEELQKHGAHIDAFYYCPHLTDGAVEAYREDCDCRKPKPGMLLRAMKEHDIDPARAVMIGDAARDVECAERAGIRGTLYAGGSLLPVTLEALDSCGI